MWRVPMEVSGFEGRLNYVDCCPNKPLPGQALCEEHCKAASLLNIPTTIKEFPKHSKSNHPCSVHSAEYAILYLIT